MKLSSWERRVLAANRKVFDAKNFDEYQTNPSIFEPSRQAEVGAILKDESRKYSSIRNPCAIGKKRILDIGCGTGNVLRLARGEYSKCYGIDLSRNLLAELKRREPDLGLSIGESGTLPFKDASFQMITMYGVLHHIIDQRSTFREAFRVLEPGGTLYTDHDPNYFFGRFFHLYYRMRYLNRPGFGDEDTELSEYHHTRTGGLNPMEIKAELELCGFHDVQVTFRITTNPHLPIQYRFARFVLSRVAKIYPFRSCYTHFWILARKR